MSRRPSSQRRPVMRAVAELGALRLSLWALALVVLVLMPSPETRAVYSGWDMITTLLAPVMAPIVAMVLLLDALMSRVFLSDATESQRRVLVRALIVNLVLAALLLVRFVPYLLSR
jgi:hypothetical protein